MTNDDVKEHCYTPLYSVLLIFALEWSTYKGGNGLARRKSYRDTSTGAADEGIRRLLEDCDDGSKRRNLLLNVIKNELTARQTEIIMLYYFKGLDVMEIAGHCGITKQAVSAVMARARKNIYKYMKYYIRGGSS